MDEVMPKKKESTAEEKLLLLARDRMEVAERAEYYNRGRGVENLKFVDGEDQWPEKIKKQRDIALQPSLTLNHMRGFIKQVVNEQRQNRPQIKVDPVDSEADPMVARHLEGLIRNIEYQSTAASIYDEAFKHCSSAGYPGHWRVNTRYEDEMSFNQECVIEPIRNQFSVYADPDAVQPDRSDRKWCFIVEEITNEEFKQRYGKDVPATDVDVKGLGDNFDKWYHDDKVRIAEYWTLEERDCEIVMLEDGTVVKREDAKGKKIKKEDGKEVSRKTKENVVKQYMISGADVLEGPKDWAGKIIPIVSVYPEEMLIDGEVKYYSVIQDAKDPQRMHNYWQSVITEKVALAPRAPYMLTKSMLKDNEKLWDQAHRTVLPYLVVNDTPAGLPRREQGEPLPEGAYVMSQAAVDEMKATTSIYDARRGDKSNETSGKAIIERRQQSETATFSFIDNLSRAIQLTGKILINLIPKIYDVERQIRIRGEDASTAAIWINSKRDGKPYNDFKIGKYDVRVDTGPSYNTQREEARDSMIQFIQAVPQAGVAFMDKVAKAMNWPDADEISERMKAILPPEIRQIADTWGKEDSESPEVMQARMVYEAQIAQLTEAAALQGQALEEMQAQLAQAQQQLADKQAEYAIKQSEVEAKVEEIRLKAQTESERIEADKEIARINQEGNEELKSLESEIRDLKTLVSGMDKGLGYVIEQSGEEDNGKKEGATVALIDPTVGRVTKTIKIKAPSGKEYTGQSVEEPTRATQTGEQSPEKD